MLLAFEVHHTVESIFAAVFGCFLIVIWIDTQIWANVKSIQGKEQFQSPRSACIVIILINLRIH